MSKKKNNKKAANAKKVSARFVSDIVTIVLFLAVIFGFAVAFVAMPDVSSRYFESGLQRLPEPDKEDVIHGKFATQMDEYFCDQFPLREQFVTLKAGAEIATMRSVNNGVLRYGDYCVKVRFNSVGFKNETEFYSKEHVEKTLTSLKNAIDQTEVPVDVMLPPRAVDVIGPIVDYPTYTGDMLNAQAAEILGDNYVDVMDTLRGLNDENMIPYFITDHHWTPVGAFFAFEEWMNRWNDRNPQFESFDYDPVKFDFLGTSARNGNYLNHRGEVLDVVRFTGDEKLKVELGQSLSAMQEKTGLYDMDALNGADPFNVFLYGKTNYVRVTHNTEERETVLVVKDSFAHVFVPHLTRYYNVVMVDLDLALNGVDLSYMVEKTGADRVLIMYNMQNVIENDKLSTIKA